MVKTAKLDENDHLTVYVKLKSFYSDEIRSLTSKNIGKILKVVSGNQVLLSAPIKAKIESGIFVIGHWESKTKALSFISKMTAKR